MARILLFLSIAVMLMAASQSCRRLKTPKKEVVCPLPVQACTPEKWEGLEYDTSAETVKFLDYYYTFRQLSNTNTPGGEWQLAFFEKNRAFLTFTDVDRQNVMIVSMVGDNSTMMLSGIGLPFEGYAGAFSARNDEVYMGAVADSGYTGNSDLYVSKKQGAMFTDMQKLPDNLHKNEFTWESHPAISAGGSVLFFASDRTDGFGGTDIWYSVKLSEGKWSDPINCGSHINSRCEEITPYITDDGSKLYFASCGRQTVGGYDIFESNIVSEFWDKVKSGDLEALRSTNYFSTAKNMRPPLNTPFDEIFPSCPGNCDSLMYYSSNQLDAGATLVSMQGGFDLFVRRKIVPARLEDTKKRELAEGEIPEFGAEMPEDKIKEPVMEISPVYTLEGRVYNAISKEPVPNADITVREMPFNAIVKETESDDEGNYEVDLDKNKEFEVTAHAKDLFFDTFKVRVDKDNPRNKLKKDIYIPESFTLRVNFPTDAYKNPYKYTLDSNGIETNQTWQDELDKLAQNIKFTRSNLKKLILIGHTDDVGSVEYNMGLGERRVTFIIEELVKRGVPAEMLEGRSAGENEPLLKRPGENIRMYRKRLRRVELRKVQKE